MMEEVCGLFIEEIKSVCQFTSKLLSKKNTYEFNDCLVRIRKLLVIFVLLTTLYSMFV